MKTNRNNRLVGLLIGILLLGLSYAADWAYLAKAHFDGPSDRLRMSIPITITGTHGTVGVAGLSLPVWLIITLGILALTLMLLNQVRITALPSILCITIMAISGIYMVVPIMLGFFVDGAQLRIGCVLGIVGLIVGSFAGLRKVTEDDIAATAQRL